MHMPASPPGQRNAAVATAPAPTKSLLRSCNGILQPHMSRTLSIPLFGLPKLAHEQDCCLGSSSSLCIWQSILASRLLSRTSLTLREIFSVA